MTWRCKYDKAPFWDYLTPKMKAVPRAPRVFLGGNGGRSVGLTTLPPSCADCLKIRKPQPPGILRPSSSLYRDYFTSSIVSKRQWLYHHNMPEVPDLQEHSCKNLKSRTSVSSKSVGRNPLSRFADCFCTEDRSNWSLLPSGSRELSVLLLWPALIGSFHFRANGF